MFCKHCGNEVNEMASFCKNCGNEIGKSVGKEYVEDRLEYQVKPFFCFPYKLIVTVLWALLISVFFLGEFFIFVITEGRHLLIPMGLVLAIGIAIKLIIDKNQYAKLEYNFYTTKLEYVDGFFSLMEKEVKHKYIREVRMSQSVLQRIFNLGTIVLNTTATGGAGATSKHHGESGTSGIAIHCVPNVEEQYQRIKQIVDNASED